MLMREKYLHQLQLLETGVSSETSEFLIHLREAENFDKNIEVETYRRLLAIRGQMYYGKSVPQSHLAMLEPKLINDSFLKAECHFVRGLNFYYMSEFIKGAAEFRLASTYYSIQFMDKVCLALYNELSGLINSNCLSDFEMQEKLSSLEKLCFNNNVSRVLALVIRQKAFYLYSRKKYFGAQSSAEEAVRLFKEGGYRADLQIAMIILALIYYELNNFNEAKKLQESILLPIENRILFPYHILEVLLSNSAPKNPENFSVVQWHWLEIYNQKFKNEQIGEKNNSVSYVWNYETGMLFSNKNEFLDHLKRGTVEGRLVEMLVEQKLSSVDLIERLWPEYAAVEQLNGRLHQVLKRVKKKLPILKFEYNFYSIPINSIKIIK